MERRVWHTNNVSEVCVWKCKRIDLYNIFTSFSRTQTFQCSLSFVFLTDRVPFCSIFPERISHGGWTRPQSPAFGILSAEKQQRAHLFSLVALSGVGMETWSECVKQFSEKKKYHNFCLASASAIRFRGVRRSEWASSGQGAFVESRSEPETCFNWTHLLLFFLALRAV